MLAPALMKSAEMLWRQVLRSICDAEVFLASALDRGLEQPASTSDDELAGLALLKGLQSCRVLVQLVAKVHRRWAVWISCCGNLQEQGMTASKRASDGAAPRRQPGWNNRREAHHSASKVRATNPRLPASNLRPPRYEPTTGIAVCAKKTGTLRVPAHTDTENQ